MMSLRLPYAQLQLKAVSRIQRATMSTVNNSPYAQTIRKFRIDDSTRVIYQGFTGKAATANARDTLAYGTKIVGGVSPKKGGSRHLDLPVYNTVREAKDNLNPHTTVVFVPALLAAKAIEEAISAQVPLIVSVTEHIPVHDMLRIQQILLTQSGSRLVGPNCPGIISPGGKCCLGIMPYQQYMPGTVGIVSKSGTLSYEAVGATSRAGLGQSLVVGMGGDVFAGTALVDALELFYGDERTKGIVVIGEIGGKAEFRAAGSIREYYRSARKPKPIVAMVAGKTAPEGQVMGHAGAVLRPGERGAEAKATALAQAGATVVPHPGLIGVEMKRLYNEMQ